MTTLWKGSLLTAAVLASLAVAPPRASAEGLWAEITQVFTDNNATNRQILVGVKPLNKPNPCGTLPASAYLRWRESEATKNYKDGVRLLTGALTARAVVIFDVTVSGSQCRVNSMLVATP